MIFNFQTKKRLFLTLMWVIFFMITSCGGGNKFENLSKKAKDGNKEALSTIVKALQEDPESKNRALAARALIGLVDEEVSEALLKQYKIDDDTVRPAILEALYHSPTQKIFPMMRQTYYSSKSSQAEKIICIKGFARSDIKAAHDIVKVAAWGKPEKQYLDGGGYAPEDFDESKIQEDENGVFIWEFLKDNPLQNEAIKAIGNFKVKSAEKTLQGVLLNERFSGIEPGILAVEALAKLNSPNAFYYIGKFINSYKPGMNEPLLRKTASALSNYSDEKLVDSAGAMIAGLYYHEVENKSDEKKQEVKKEYEKLLKKMKTSTFYAICTPGVLNVRKNASARAAKIGICKKGEAFPVTEKGKLKQQIDSFNDYWYQVQLNSRYKGWIYGGYIEKLNIKE